MKIVLPCCLAILFLTIGCKNPINDPIDSVVDIVTNPKAEIAKGVRHYPFALAESGGELTQFPVTHKYINNLVLALSQHTSVQFPWEIRLVNNKSINAWALPGGKIGIYYGLLLETENEAELVSVLSHEMAHSIELHGTGRETFATLINLAAQIVEIGISKPGTQPDSNRILHLGRNIFTGQYSQSNELEADRLGVDLMVRAGFNPRGAIDMQEKLALMQSGRDSFAQKLWGTHPVSAERIEATIDVVSRYPLEGRENSLEFKAAKTEIQDKFKALKTIQKAREAYGRGELNSALNFVNRAIQLLKNEHSFWHLNAELLVANGKPVQAIQAALKVKKLNPSDPISELLLSYCYTAAGQLSNANAARERASTLIR